MPPSSNHVVANGKFFIVLFSFIHILQLLEFWEGDMVLSVAKFVGEEGRGGLVVMLFTAIKCTFRHHRLNTDFLNIAKNCNPPFSTLGFVTMEMVWVQNSAA